MDATTLNTIVGIIGAIVGLIGIVVGIIGFKSIATATKIKNSIKADTVQQAQIIHNGLDDYAVIRLSREATQEELQKMIDLIKPITWEELDDVADKVKNTDEELQKLKQEVEDIPRIGIVTEDNESGGKTLIIDCGNSSNKK